MSLDVFGVNRPNQNLGAGDELALVIPEYVGEVTGTFDRQAKFAPFVDFQSVQGTATITKEGIGESTLGVITPGQTPDQTSNNQYAQHSLTVDTVVLARTQLPILDVFQKRYDVRTALGREHGKKISKFYDQSIVIQAAKAAALAQSSYGALPGHSGGTTVSVADFNAAKDPAILYAAISNLLAQMEEKDVDPQADGVVMGLRPDLFYALSDAEQIVNSNYVTFNGKEIVNAKILKAFDIPVISSNNVPRSNITNHLLSNTRNSNAYNGDFSKLVAVAFSPEALLGGETIPLTSNVFFDDVSKHWYVDSWLSYGVKPDVAAKAGRIVTL